MTTAVYFDLDNTLLEYTASFGEITAGSLPVEPTEEMLVRYSDAVLGAITELQSNPYERAFAAVCEEHGLDSDPSTLATRHIENEAEATRIQPAVRRLVETVSARHPTGILTNGDGRAQRRKIEAHGLETLVDTVIVSNEFGARKPDPEIFEEAKRRLDADEYIYIGDTFEEDIVPAREQGFGTVYVGDESRPAAPVSAADMTELADVLLPLIETKGK
ncbi:haloacid dehalogenase [Haladaptatus sp. R4]|uniref:HAD family hydrolase n=1 Tax=Haladaptatus sp. R4 TaxID=1679489 RepID=UPI0007B4C749|nr:HAD family hydrolase [Haladaptatus sp. R4]KZN23827.1 haloacid dehalogenase [Haladaptatus sp. R4]